MYAGLSLILGALTIASGSGCADRSAAAEARRAQIYRSRVIVVAPVLNLSDNADVDTLRLTDWIASEFLRFDNQSVVPVNLTLAALARMGKGRVETPADAYALASEFGADATVVTAITEYDPYDPPHVGMVMQWYGQTPSAGPRMDPVLASRESSALQASAPALAGAPAFQVQRGYDAADERVLDELEDYAEDREGHLSPYGWRKYVKSQELFVRYCAWSSIRTMLRVETNSARQAAPSEAQ